MNDSMDSNRRPLILAGILAAVLAVWAGKPMFLGPLEEARVRLQNAEADLEEAEEQDFQLQLARGRLEEAQFASLPPSLNDAQRLYLKWITDLAHECELSRLEVSPGRKEVRGSRYQLVSVTLQGEATLPKLSRFLYLFRQADLKHRLTQLDVSSTGTSGNPRLEITLTAEGMCVPGSAMKNQLAGSTQLTDDTTADATTLTVGSAEGFPTSVPFLAIVDSEIVQVTAVDDLTWTVERGQEGSTAEDHSAAARLHHFPVAWQQKERSFADFQTFLDESLFLKPEVPREYHPELAGVESVVIAPGESVSMTARIDDYNPDVGSLQYSLQDAAEGIEIDPESGRISWETAKDTAPGEYTAVVRVIQQNNEELDLQQSLTVTVRLPNETPQLTLDDTATVWIGREFELQPEATDDGSLKDLTWSLEGENLPEGLQIDAKNGQLTWEPAATLPPAEHKVTVKVTDQGDPPSSATHSLTLQLKQDAAASTRLSGIWRNAGKAEAWLEDPGTNTRLTLHVGDRLQVADIDAEVVDIQARVITLEDDAGRWLLGLDNPVRDRVLQKTSDEAKPDTAVQAQSAVDRETAVE